MQINIVKPFMPNLSEIADDFAQCLQSGLVTNNSPQLGYSPHKRWNGRASVGVAYRF